ncbi:MAG: peptidyl-prolyl cis-trans isomerase, partial [Thermosipho sp. (in: Bacteria)]|nr:peptidyl-prolyl cis-trans isomerase [Thermosipho sp. (in: thermotogales)]
MRKWFEKAHGAIIWTIAIAFVVGIVIWSVSSYVSGRSSSKTANYTLSDTVAYLTKDGTALNSDYWIFPWDVENSYSQALS